VTPVRFTFNRTEVYHISKASSLRWSPPPLKVGGRCSFAANQRVLSSTGCGGDAGSPCFFALNGNSPGLVAVSFSSYFADLGSTTSTSSQDTWQAALSISKCLLVFFCSLRALSLIDFSVDLVSSSGQISLPVLVFRFKIVSMLTC